MASNVSGVRPHHIMQAITEIGDIHGDGTSATLDEALAYYENERTSLGLDKVCAKCGTKGEYPLSKDTGIPSDTTMVTCDQCNGWGMREVANRAIIAGYENIPE